MVARGIGTILKKTLGTFEVFRLKDAATVLKQGTHAHDLATMHLDTSRCHRCFREKATWEGALADAGQFFEVVQPQGIDSAMAYLLQSACQEHPQKLVTVKSSKNRQAFIGGTLGNPYKKQRTFHFSELNACVSAASRVPLVTVGKSVAKMLGVPIGAHLSKVGCSLVLGAAEDQWCRLGHAKRCGFLPEGVPSRMWAAAVRYVDDAVLLSKILRKSCLLAALATYSPVPFDPVDTCRTIPWLDLSINLDTLHITLACKHYQTAPPWALTPTDLRSYVLGRMARWSEVRTSLSDVVSNAARLTVELSTQGWSREVRPIPLLRYQLTKIFSPWISEKNRKSVTHVV